MVLPLYKVFAWVYRVTYHSERREDRENYLFDTIDRYSKCGGRSGSSGLEDSQLAYSSRIDAGTDHICMDARSQSGIACQYFRMRYSCVGPVCIISYESPGCRRYKAVCCCRHICRNGCRQGDDLLLFGRRSYIFIFSFKRIFIINYES